jgi:hypothetical protein
MQSDDGMRLNSNPFLHAYPITWDICIPTFANY